MHPNSWQDSQQLTAGYKRVWNFFSIEGKSKNSKILFSYKSVHGTEMLRKSLFEMTTVVS